MEEIIAKTQMGLDKSIDANAGLFGIMAARDYTTPLMNIYKYDLLNE